jgi:hypothetical protein
MNKILSISILIYLTTSTFYTNAETQWISAVEPNPLTYTEFGQDIAIMGEWLIVGDPMNDDVANNAGAIHVYQDNNGQWSHFQTLYPVLNDDDLNVSLDSDELGSSVDIEINHLTGEIWIVGAALRDDGLNLDNGAVYLYNYVDQGMGQFAFEYQKKIIGESFQINKNFGSSVAINLDYIEETNANEWVLVVGDDSKVYNLQDDSIPPNVTPTATGGVNVYKKNDGIEDTFWVDAVVQTGQIYLNGLTSNDFIGRSVAVDGKTIVVGAPGDDDHDLGSDGFEMGAIHVLTRDGLTQVWACCAVIYPAERIKFGRLGTAVDVIKQPNNNRIILGGAPEDVLPHKGSVYTWFNGLMVQRIEAPLFPGNQGELFGSSLAANGDSYFGTNQLIVGAPRSGNDLGRVHKYVVNPDFDGMNDLYILNDTVVAYNNNVSPWITGRFGSVVTTDGSNHAASSFSTLLGSHRSVYTQEQPIFANGFGSPIQQ